MATSQASRVGCTIDQSVPVALQVPVNITRPLTRPVQATVEQVKDPTILAKQLASIQAELAQTTLAARSHPIQQPIIFTNIVCGTSGTKTTVQHNFNRFAYFLVIGWRGNSTTASPSLVCDQSDAANVITTKNKIALRSYVSGTADIMVF